MLANVAITPWHWAGFIVVILFFIALDLGVFHRQAHVVGVKEGLAWTSVWFVLSMLFAGGLAWWRGQEEAAEFITGYIIELTLSMDNVFVIAVIFSYFRVPERYKHRVLFWGILGALLMRGGMIGLGAALVKKFQWMLYVLGGFLVLTGIKVVVADEEGVHPEKNIFIRMARKFFPVSNEFNGSKFFATIDGRKALTPLALVLLMVETTDLVFAFDSIPAIFAVTTKPFIVFTSNVFAILGLRSLYFALAGAIGSFRYLKVGISVILICIGTKMLLLMAGIHIKTEASLIGVGTIILVSILMSVWAARRERTG